MKSRLLSSALAWLACAGLVLPTATFADGPNAARPVIDVELNEQSALVGQVLDQQGTPAKSATVTLTSNGETFTAQTTDNGSFRFDQIKGGSYELSTANARQTVRVWQHATAPPAATDLVMLVDGQPLVRGQYPGYVGGAYDPGYGGAPGGGGAFQWLANPWVIGAAVAVAVAVPVALSDDDDDNAS